MVDAVVLDASAMIDLLRGSRQLDVADRIRGAQVHVPAHFDAEILSALGRLQRAGVMTEVQVERCLRDTTSAPFERHAIGSLLENAWSLRHNVRLADAIYVALGERLGAPVLTLDTGMAASSDIVELISDLTLGS